MNNEFVSQKAWDEFARRWPDAVNFLIRSSLEGELAHLRKMREIGALDRQPTRMARLLELIQWEATMADIERRHADGCKQSVQG